MATIFECKECKSNCVIVSRTNDAVIMDNQNLCFWSTMINASWVKVPDVD